MTARQLPGALLLALLLAAAGAPQPAAARLTLVVQVPASTPAGSTPHVSGDVAVLGSWNGSGIALAPLAAGRWVGAVELPEGARFEFKVTRGSWDTVEKDAAGGELANRSAVVHAGDTLRIEVAAWRDQFEGTSAPARSHTLVGTFLHHDRFASVFVEARDVIVWLPPGYEARRNRRYPVVYFHDGQNVFDGATSFLPGQEWRVDEAADSLIRNHRTPPFIVVAVANTSARMREYTRAADPKHGGGGLAPYERFLIEELKPFIDRTYRTRPGPSHTGIVGSSLGGLASLALGLDHPEVFGLVGAVSPSVWFADRDILTFARAGTGHPFRLWLDMGGAEGSAAAAGSRPWLDDARALRDALVARGWREGADLRYVEAEGAAHNEQAWARRVPAIIEFLLSGARD